MKVRNTNGSIQSYLVERNLRHKSKVLPQAKKTKRYPTEVATQHQPSKMEARGILQGQLWQLKIITEREPKFEHLITDLKGKKTPKQKLREEVFNILYDTPVENVEEGNYYFFEYDPKFKSVLKE